MKRTTNLGACGKEALAFLGLLWRDSGRIIEPFFGSIIGAAPSLPAGGRKHRDSGTIIEPAF